MTAEWGVAGDGEAVPCSRRFGDEPVAEHWLEVRAGALGATVEGAPPSLVLPLEVPPGSGVVHWWASAWGAEWEPERDTLDETVRIVSLAGRSSGRCHPSVLIETPAALLAVCVAWSGNWELLLLRRDETTVELRAGLADPGFAHAVAPHATFRTPSVVVAEAADGDRETAARALARVGRAAWFRRRPVAARMPAEWNHWWPYEDGGIDEATFRANAAAARDAGLDVAVLDAGWFGPPGDGPGWYDLRGDWDRVNTERFPGGLEALAADVHGLGLGFGLWLEVEAVGGLARLRAERPELLAIGQPAPDAPVRAGGGVVADPEGRPVDLGYVCLGNPEARDWAFATIARYAEACDLDWLKLDFNLDPGLGCTRDDHGHGARDGLWAHVTGLYDVLERLRDAYPRLLLEACSSGGMRWDHGIARHVDVGFQSDPDWPDHALQVLWASSLFYPLETLLHWCDSEWRGEHPQQTFHADDPALDPARFDLGLAIAMLGPFGLSQRLVDLPPWAQTRLGELVEVYRRWIGPCVARGELRRLSEQPRRDGTGPRWVGFQLDVADRDPVAHLVAVFRLDGAGETCGLHAAGLPPDRELVVRSLLAGTVHRATSDADGRLALAPPLTATGAWLATIGEAA